MKIKCDNWVGIWKNHLWKYEFECLKWNWIAKDWVWHWYLNLKQKIKVKETKMNKMSAKKVKSEVENEEIVMYKLSVNVKTEETMGKESGKW